MVGYGILAAHANVTVRTRVAADCWLPPEIVVLLADDPHVAVRKQVAMRSDLPQDLQIRLARDRATAIDIATNRGATDATRQLVAATGSPAILEALLRARVVLDSETIAILLKRIPESASQLAWRSALAGAARGAIFARLSGRRADAELLQHLAERDDLTEPERVLLLTHARTMLNAAPAITTKSHALLDLRTHHDHKARIETCVGRLARHAKAATLVPELDRAQRDATLTSSPRLTANAAYNRSIVIGALLNTSAGVGVKTRATQLAARYGVEKSTRGQQLVPISHQDHTAPTTVFLTKPTGTDVHSAYCAAEAALGVAGSVAPRMLLIAYAPVLSDAQWRTTVGTAGRLLAAARADAPYAVVRDWLASDQHPTSELAATLAVSSVDARVIVCALAATGANERERLLRRVLRAGAWTRPAARARCADLPTLGAVLITLLDDLAVQAPARWQPSVRRRLQALTTEPQADADPSALLAA